MSQLNQEVHLHLVFHLVYSKLGHKKLIQKKTQQMIKFLERMQRLMISQYIWTGNNSKKLTIQVFTKMTLNLNYIRSFLIMKKRTKTITSYLTNFNLKQKLL